MKAFLRKHMHTCLLSFLMTAGILIVLFLINGYAPFGSSSLACNDANLQYLDFFLYFKDVLSGSNSISYTFSKMLGGSAAALYGYYLASPINLLLIFFRKEQVLVFFDLAVLLKLALAAFTCAYYLSARFEKATADSRQNLLMVLLSACYALSQYAISQSANIMWLDGLFMLPLVMLGIYRVINGGPLWKLSLPVAMVILFNWYVAGICCLFSIAWFFAEFILCCICPANSLSDTIRRFFAVLLRYGLGMFFGVLCSAVLFFPVVVAMSSTAKGELDPWMMLVLTFRTSLRSVLETSIYGGLCTEKTLSLYCGALPLAGTLRIFTEKNRKKEIIVTILGLLFLLLMFCWNPLYTLFNLLADPSSFYCRFSFVQIFTLIFLAGLSVLSKTQDCTNRYGWFPGILYATVLTILIATGTEANRVPGYLTAAVLAAVSLCLHSALTSSRRMATALLFLLTITDLGYSTDLLFQHYHNENGAETTAYISNQQALIHSLAEKDGEIYRISQLKNRGISSHRRTASYDEALGYGYRSISEYSSAADSRQLDFLDKTGYSNIGDMMSITNTSILGIDSLLGVKYILSDYAIRGLTEESGYPIFDGKHVYRNPYALPLAFLCQVNPSIDVSYNDDPFQYQNALFSALAGEAVEIYSPLSYEKQPIGNPDDEGRMQTYTLSLPEGHYAVYGNLPWESAGGTPYLNLNDKLTSIYACWLSPSVFYIPTEPGDRSATVSAQGNVNFIGGKEQFYVLDLDRLEKITQTLRSAGSVDIRLENGRISMTADAAEGDCIFLSVPSDRGWEIRRNGIPAEPTLFADLFYMVPLQQGANTIEMRYQVPGFSVGLSTTILSMGVLILVTILSKKNQS